MWHMAKCHKDLQVGSLNQKNIFRLLILLILISKMMMKNLTAHKYLKELQRQWSWTLWYYRLQNKVFSHKLKFEAFRLDIRKTSLLGEHYSTATGYSKRRWSLHPGKFSTLHHTKQLRIWSSIGKSLAPSETVDWMTSTVSSSKNFYDFIINYRCNKC